MRRLPNPAVLTSAALAPAALVLVLTGCSATAPESAPTTSRPAPTSSPAPTTSADDGQAAAAQARFAALEEEFDARLGLFALDTGSGRVLAHRADERFAFASTFKALAAGAVLAATTEEELDAVVTWDEQDLVPHSPVTGQRTRDGLPLRDVARAAVTVSDNTAANLLLERVGGPAGLEADLRALGDATTEVEDVEPAVNDVAPGQVANTSTPRALAQALRAYALGDALDDGDRAQLLEWLRANETGDEMVRAGVPDGWGVGDKTGRSGAYGNLNDVAVVQPPDGRAPWVLAVLTDRADVDAEPDPALVARAARVVVDHLG
ncbi:class A beta-lactamase [Kineococcus sp. SYSU DK004]|uniref:class A beta-lactamase n=1 Tax=Kineococcus sp. SYSU DK004 TaxID=3383125 RepID=UPI003D7DE9A4